QRSRNHCLILRFLCGLLSPLFSRHASNREGSHKGGLKKNGTASNRTCLSESVLLWLQGNWTEPDPPRFYPLKEVEQGPRYYSVRRNRRDVIIEQPAFLPPRSASAR